MRILRTVLGLLLSALLASCASTGGNERRTKEDTGIVVEAVSKASAFEKAGIVPGDTLVSWERTANPPANPAPSQGALRSPFDAAEAETEEAPRGPFTIRGMRQGKAIAFSVPPGSWGAAMRPQLSGERLETYLAGKKLTDEGKLDEGIRFWRQLLANLAKETDVASWLLQRIGDTHVEAKSWHDAQAAYGEAIRLVEGVSSPSAPSRLSQLWQARGSSYEKQREPSKADEAYEEALRARGVATENLAIASLLSLRGWAASTRRDLDAAAGYHQKSLAIKEELAPGSLVVARSLSHLGVVAGRRGNLVEATGYFQRALAIQEELAPGRREVASTLNNLGNVARNRGDLAEAGGYFHKALEIVEELAPGSLDVAPILDNLGVVAGSRGDLAEAASYIQKSLTIRERLAPGGLDVAMSLNNLGTVLERRGDLGEAAGYQQKALAIREKLAPGSLDVALSLNNLGDIAYERGDRVEAEGYLQRALTIREKLAPGSLNVALIFHRLGLVARERGDLVEATDYYQKALAIQEKLAPGSLDVADSLHALGEVASSRGASVEEKQLLLRALEIREHVAPGSADHAKVLHALGLLSRREKDLEAAATWFRRAIDALETQKSKLGGSEEVQSGFAAGYADYYRDYIEVLLELGRNDEAFHVLERSRARGLLAMLAERDLVFADIPEDLERERKRTNQEYDRVQGEIGEWNAGKGTPELEEKLGRLRDLRAKQEEIATKIRTASPRFAALQYPQPLDVKGAAEALDPGTLLLAFSVGKERTYLFAISRTMSLRIFRIDVSEAELRQEIERFQNLIGWKKPLSRKLFDLLLRPVAALIAKSERLLVAPDRALHLIPFAALTDGKRYLAEWKPVHTVISATVYAELKQKGEERAGGGEIRLAAFGDPKYPAAAPAAPDGDEKAADAEVRALVRRGATLEPLPATRTEVEAIAALYGPAAQTFLGEAASEENAKSIGEDVRYLHFASHGFLNERFPLNSALALTIPETPAEGQENGLLQAWEIFERVRIDADLVTLSACETGLGKEMGGEGLVGLTRAFQYAGARSVLASLWSVADESTAELMKRFYSYLRDGKPKDESLRLAQMDLLRGATYAHPYHWAAFQLIGDWK